MRNRRIVAAALLVAALAATVAAQESLEAHPGFLPLDELDILSRENLKLEINLHGPLLKLVAAATRDDELGRKLNIPHLGAAQELDAGSEDEPDE